MTQWIIRVFPVSASIHLLHWLNSVNVLKCQILIVIVCLLQQSVMWRQQWLLLVDIIMRLFSHWCHPVTCEGSRRSKSVWQTPLRRCVCLYVCVREIRQQAEALSGFFLCFICFTEDYQFWHSSILLISLTLLMGLLSGWVILRCQSISQSIFILIALKINRYMSVRIVCGRELNRQLLRDWTSCCQWSCSRPSISTSCHLWWLFWHQWGNKIFNIK